MSTINEQTTFTELRKIAGELEITGRYVMNRDKLIKRIKKAQEVERRIAVFRNIGGIPVPVRISTECINMLDNMMAYVTFHLKGNPFKMKDLEPHAKHWMSGLGRYHPTNTRKEKFGDMGFLRTYITERSSDSAQFYFKGGKLNVTGHRENLFHNPNLRALRENQQWRKGSSSPKNSLWHFGGGELADAGLLEEAKEGRKIGQRHGARAANQRIRIIA